MTTQFSLFCKITIVILFLISFTSISFSQSVWYCRQKTNSITLEINKPDEPSDSIVGIVIPGVDFWSGSVFLSGRYSLPKNKNITFVADFPVAHGLIPDTIVTNGSETIIGNPYIGAEFDIPQSPIYFQLGLRIPLCPDNNFVAKLAGNISDLDRKEAFFSKVFPVYGAVNYQTVSDNKILFAARGGLNLWFNDDTTAFSSDPEVSTDYTLQTGYIDQRINVILSAVGRYAISSNAAVPTKRNFLEYGLSVVVPIKRFRPAISFRVPGNELTGYLLNYVVGLNLEYSFK